MPKASISSTDLHGNAFNHVYLYGEVTSERIHALRRELEVLSKPLVVNVNGLQVVSNPTPILLHINSPGGDLSAGLAAISAIQSCPVDVYTLVDGSAMSAAATILASGHRRFAYSTSAILIHQHWSFNSGVVRHEDTVAEGKLSQAMYDQYKRFFTAKTKLNEAELDKLLVHDRVLSAQEAKRIGLIDEIIASPSLRVIKEFAKDNYEPLSNRDVKVGPKITKNNPKRRMNTIVLNGDADEDKDPFQTPLPIVQAISAINRLATGNLFFPAQKRGDDDEEPQIRLYNGIPRPIRLSLGEEPMSDPYELLPVISAISASTIPVISVIEGNCSGMCTLLTLACHERWIYHYSVIHFDFRYEKDSSMKVADVKANTQLINNFIRRLFKTRSKLSPKMLSELFDKAFVFTAKQAVEAGLCDGILDDPAHQPTASRAIVTTTI